MFYNYFRDLDPSRGQYLQSDPVGIKAGPNTYLYGNANPLKFTDPYGLDSFGGSGSSGRRWYVPGPFDVFTPGTPANNAFVQSVKQIVKKVKDFCSSDKSCEDHLKDCLETSLADVKDGYQSRCVSCYDRCRGSPDRQWPSSLENRGTCDYGNFKLW
jgi:hypothetical protein